MPATIESSIKNPVLVQLGQIEPAFTDIITRNGETLDPTLIDEVKFFMRPLLSRIPKINGILGEKISPVDTDGNNVKYKWLEADVSEEGEYMAWWGFNFNKFGPLEETPEFPILISDHGPGIGVKTGAIFDGIGDHMPITFDALKRSSTFGERRIQKIVTLVQLRVLKEYVQPDEEIIIYELPLLDYFSKRVSLELCTPGIDYWGRQHKTINAVSPTEMASFPDMIASLEKLRVRLVDELAENWRELQFLIPGLKQRKSVPMPGSSLEFEDWEGSNGKMIRRDVTKGYVTKDPNATQKLQTGYHGNYDLFTLGAFPWFP